MSKKTTLAIAVAATLALPLSAFAQGAGGAGGAGSGAGGSAGGSASQADTAPAAPGVKGDQMGATKPGVATKKQTTGSTGKSNTDEKMRK